MSASSGDGKLFPVLTSRALGTSRLALKGTMILDLPMFPNSVMEGFSVQYVLRVIYVATSSGLKARLSATALEFDRSVESVSRLVFRGQQGFAALLRMISFVSCQARWRDRVLVFLGSPVLQDFY